jgi:leader peptidase (prepilin peptidase) / N-methyltransferase
VPPVAVVVTALVALPLGWLATVLAERVPDYSRRVFERPFRPEGASRTRLVLLTVAISATSAGVAARFDRPLVVAAYLGFSFVLIALATIDIDTQRLPDRLLLPYLAASIPALVAVAVVLREPERITAAYLGAVAYFGFLFFVHLVLGPRAIGFGDVKLAAVMGLYLGFVVTSGGQALALVMWSMLIGFTGGALIGIVLLIAHGRSRHYAFGPFLALGAIVAMLLADGLLPAA